jgi:hypothetical protein
MAEDVITLFDEYAARYARGERPDAREYLARAGAQADELARLLERFVAATPPPAPSEETVELIRAWRSGEPPLLDLRRRRGLKRAAVVDALMSALGLDPAKREKVAGYYHELESGLLDPGRVDRRVFRVLAETLKAKVEDLLAWQPPAPAGDVYYRRADADVLSQIAPAPAAPPPEEAPDEIDRLFRGAT